MSSYEIDLKNNIERNNKFMKQFESWLKKQNLSAKTINKHVSNIDLYLNDYLNYYEITKMEEGIVKVYMFLNDWFIRKCAFATQTSIKDNAASIKKFYQCMCEKNYVDAERYEFLCDTIKNNMDVFLNTLYEIENYEGEEWEGLCD